VSKAQEETPDFVAPAEAKGAYRGAPFTLFVTIVCVLVFIGEVWMTLVGDTLTWGNFGKAVVAIPPDVAMAFGANYATSSLYEGRVDTLVTSCFVHFGVLHILFNLYGLRQIGPFLEHEVGTGRVSVLYVGAGVVGSMVSALSVWHAQAQGVGAGASGALCGLIGATVVVGYRTQGWRSPLMLTMAIWLALTLILGKLGGFDNAAHGGGAVAGGLIAVLWRRGAEPRPLRILSLVVAIGTVVAAGGAVLYNDVKRPFATMSAPDRLKYAQQAALLGACDDAWAAARSARRLAGRSAEVLQTVQYVRVQCGQDPHAPRGLDAGGASQ